MVRRVVDLRLRRGDLLTCMRRTLLVATAFLLLTAGCGSDDGKSPADDTPTSAAPSTSAAPASTLIDYGDDEISVTRAADATKLTGAPKDFKEFIVTDLARQQSVKDDACTEKPEIHVAKIDTRGWAAGGSFIPQCGGNATLWARTGGTWKEVWAGQTLPDCKTLDKYRFPASVVGKECGTDDGGTRAYPS